MKEDDTRVDGQPVNDGRPTAASNEPRPTEQPPDVRGRFMLNEYGRHCWDLGYAAAKADALVHPLDVVTYRAVRAAGLPRMKVVNREANEYARVFNRMASEYGYDLPMDLIAALVGLFETALEPALSDDAVGQRGEDVGTSTRDKESS